MDSNKYITVKPKGEISLETYSKDFDLKGRKDELPGVRYIDEADISLRHIRRGAVEPNVHAIYINFSSRVRITENNKTEIIAGQVAGFRKLILTINEEECIELKNDPFTHNCKDEDEKKTVEETDFVVSKEILEKMCKADFISMRIIGMYGEWDISNPLTFPFQFMAKVFWDAFYKDSLYSDQIKKQMSIDEEKEIVRTKGRWLYRVCLGISILAITRLTSKDEREYTFVYWMFILLPLIVAGVHLFVQYKKANKIPNTWDKSPDVSCPKTSK